MLRTTLLLLCCLALFAAAEDASPAAAVPPAAPHAKPVLSVPPAPGTVIHHQPAASGLYIGSPSLCVLPDGSYLASHDLFGPKSAEYQLGIGRIYRSTDGGKTWQHLTDLTGFFWTKLFVHRGVAYALGTEKHHGRVVIRRSTDRGTTWSEATVLAEGQWHTAPVPVIEHDGRLWRAIEDAENGIKWGERYRARMMSIPVTADPMVAANWTISNPLTRDASWLDGQFAAWLEGNAVVDPQGNLVNVLRVDKARLPEHAAMVRISKDGTTATFDPTKDFIEFPGGAKKFTIRKDPKGAGYWSLATIVPAADAAVGHPAAIRNTLALVHSMDLRTWDTRCLLLRHPDVAKHGFQYVDWQFDGDDLIAACRTAWDDAGGGAHNNHDANFLTFHRWKNFRELTRADDVPLPVFVSAVHEAASFTLRGSAFQIARLNNGETAFSNRNYRYFEVTETSEGITSLTVIPDPTPPRWARNVSARAHAWPSPTEAPFFAGPIPFVKAPVDPGEAFYSHNHQPSITWLPNGDVFAIWYSTKEETGTELTVLASRFRQGASEWDPASVFFKAENHNMHGSAIFHDGKGTLHHLNGIAPAGAKGWAKLALLHRSSADDGITWTAPRAVAPAFEKRHQVISGTIQASDGTLIQPCDAVPGGEGGTALHLSRDAGTTWSDPGLGQPPPTFKPDTPGLGTIAGIHAGVAQLADSSLIALGRGNSIDGHMPLSRSTDLGKNWSYSASPFPPIGGGQRLVLRRLREGPLLLVSFTNSDRKNPRRGGLTFTCSDGSTFTGHGLFAALSFDGGASWPVRKLVTPGKGDFDGGAWTGKFTATPENAEPAGYLAATQPPDGTIHLISSGLHYRFNLPWLRQPASPSE